MSHRLALCPVAILVQCTIICHLRYFKSQRKSFGFPSPEHFLIYPLLKTEKQTAQLLRFHHHTTLTRSEVMNDVFNFWARTCMYCIADLNVWF